MKKKQVSNGKPKEEKKQKPVEKDDLVSKVNKVRRELLSQYGANSVRMASDLNATYLPRLSSGSVELNDKLGGGFPLGRMHHIAGDKSTGKTTLMLHMIREAQQYSCEYKWINRYMEGAKEVVETLDGGVSGLMVAYLDMEGTFDPEWAVVNGVDLDKLILLQPDGLEEASNMISALQKKGIHIIIVDSVDALIGQKEADKEAGESSQMGERQKEIGRILKKFVTFNNRLTREGHVPCTLFMLNQIRTKIGVVYGSPTFIGGGKALEFYASIELHLKLAEYIKIGNGKLSRIVGQTVKFLTHKNKTYSPKQEGEYDLYTKSRKPFTAGEIDNFKSIILLCIEYGIIDKAGSWYKLDGENLAQGANALIAKAREDEDLYNTLLERLIESRGYEDVEATDEIEGDYEE